MNLSLSLHVLISTSNTLWVDGIIKDASYLQILFQLFDCVNKVLWNVLTMSVSVHLCKKPLFIQADLLRLYAIEWARRILCIWWVLDKILRSWGMWGWVGGFMTRRWCHADKRIKRLPQLGMNKSWKVSWVLFAKPCHSTLLEKIVGFWDLVIIMKIA